MKRLNNIEKKIKKAYLNKRVSKTLGKIMFGLGIYKFKLLDYYKESDDKNNVYEIKYKMLPNLYSPLTYIVFLIMLFCYILKSIYDTVKEIIDAIKDSFKDTYSDTIKIKEKDNDEEQ